MLLALTPRGSVLMRCAVDARPQLQGHLSRQLRGPIPEGCASGPSLRERFMCPIISHMPNHLSLPQVEIVVFWHVTLTRSLPVFADVPP